MGSIYKIINVVNGKLYIGSTMHKFSKRKSEHLTALRKGYHFNSHLQSAWNKYGEENFIFEILERFSDARLFILSGRPCASSIITMRSSYSLFIFFKNPVICSI